MEELLLDDNMERNYHALQSFLNNKSREKKRRGAHSRIKDKLERLEAQNFRCLDCGIIMSVDRNGPHTSATIDHVIPYRFGATIYGNCELICKPCNQTREKNTLLHILRFFGSIPAKREYKEIELLVGKFRMYEDEPTKWIQITGKNIVKVIVDNFEKVE